MQLRSIALLPGDGVTDPYKLFQAAKPLGVLTPLSPPLVLTQPPSPGLRTPRAAAAPSPGSAPGNGGGAAPGPGGSAAMLGRRQAVPMATRKRRTARGVTAGPAPS